jgi:hypothetical protein
MVVKHFLPEPHLDLVAEHFVVLLAVSLLAADEQLVLF